MADQHLRAVVEVIDRASPVMDRTLTTLSRGLRNIGLQMAIAGGVVTGFAALAINAANAQGHAEKALRLTVEATGVSWDSKSKAIQAAIKEAQKFNSATKTEMIAPLDALIKQTGNVNAALAAFPAIAAFAQAIGQPLADIAKLFGAAMTGDAGAVTELNKLGAKLKSAPGDWSGLLTDLKTTIAPHLAGLLTPWDKLKQAIGDTQAAIGKELVISVGPVIEKLNDIVRGYAEWRESHSGVAKALELAVFGSGGIILTLGTVAIAAGTVVSSIDAIIKVMANLKAAGGLATALGFATTGSMVLIVAAALLVLLGILVLVITHWKEINAAFDTFTSTTAGKVALAITGILIPPIGALALTLMALRTDWGAVWGWIESAFRDTVNFLNEGFNFIKEGVNLVGKAIDSISGKPISVKFERTPRWEAPIPPLTGAPTSRGPTRIPAEPTPETLQFLESQVRPGRPAVGVQTEELPPERNLIPAWARLESAIDRITKAMTPSTATPTPVAALTLPASVAAVPASSSQSVVNITVNQNGPVFGEADLSAKINEAVRNAARAGGYQGVFEGAS